MHVNGVILTTGSLSEQIPNLALETVNTKSFLEWQIYELRSIRKDPIVVLGPDGDDLLRAVPKLSDRKLTFSRNYKLNDETQIRIGLTGAGTCAFYLPLNVPCPAPIVWQELEKALASMPYNAGPHIYQPEFRGQPGFPLLITPRGKDWILEQPESSDLFKMPGISIARVTVASETALQIINNPHDFEDWKSLYTA